MPDDGLLFFDVLPNKGRAFLNGLHKSTNHFSEKRIIWQFHDNPTFAHLVKGKLLTSVEKSVDNVDNF